MSDSNPYQSPSMPASPFEGHTEVDTVLYEATQSLAQTKPWVRFLSVLGFLGSASAFAFVLLGAVIGGGAPGTMELILMVPICLLFYFIPSLLLWKYAGRIGVFLRGSSPASFSAAITAQMSFWRYVGILALIIVIIYGMIFIWVILLDVGLIKRI